MSTKLEKYLKEQRSTFDVEFPDDNAIWKGVSGKSGKKNQPEAENKVILRSQPNLWKAAAIILLVLSLGYVTVDSLKLTGPGKVGSIAGIDQDIQRQETEYLNTVKLKQKEVKGIDLPNSDIIHSLLEELKLLDNLYKEAIGDIESIDNRDQVINTIFSIYERKIDILERIIIETNKSHNYEENNEVRL